jgi:hypothetical protein
MKHFVLTSMLILLSFSSLFAGDECLEGDCQNGQGTMLYATGHKFSGTFKDGDRHGEGVLILPGGRKLVGVWEFNEIRRGTYTFADGTVYEGQWQFRERSGKGTLTYADGRRYEGDFSDGQRHGTGMMTWPDGRRYSGDFQHGERTGKGTMTYPDGRRYVGEFRDGERTGWGKLIYPNGRVEEGNFENGTYLD